MNTFRKVIKCSWCFVCLAAKFFYSDEVLWESWYVKRAMSGTLPVAGRVGDQETAHLGHVQVSFWSSRAA